MTENTILYFVKGPHTVFTITDDPAKAINYYIDLVFDNGILTKEEIETIKRDFIENFADSPYTGPLGKTSWSLQWEKIRGYNVVGKIYETRIAQNESFKNDVDTYRIDRMRLNEDIDC